MNCSQHRDVASKYGEAEAEVCQTDDGQAGFVAET